MKKLLTVREFLWRPIELAAYSICFVLVGALLVKAHYQDQVNKVTKIIPTLRADYSITIQEWDYVITQGDRIVTVVQRGGELDSLICLDNL